MQDYNYNFAGCLDITMELSCCKLEHPDLLMERWRENKESLTAFIQQVHIGKIIKQYIHRTISRAKEWPVRNL